MELYTIVKMAKVLKIPESTTRYYRDRHSEFLPFIGSGRKRRYKKEVLEALRLIVEMAISIRNKRPVKSGL
jgi:DNA-binding transcriptional MerR regulator